MEFIKNIKGEFFLSSKYKIRQLSKFKNIKNGNIKVKVSNIDMYCVKFKVVDFGNIDDNVDIIIKSLIKDLKDKVVEAKRIAEKVIYAWDTNQKSFIFQEKNYKEEKVYKNRNLLTNDEYSHYTGVSFENIFISELLSFTTGLGSSTYFEKHYYTQKLSEIDEWLETQIKVLEDNKMRKRVVNALNKMVFEFSFNDVVKYITPDTTLSIKNKKDKFPLSIKGEQLNNILYSCSDEHQIIDDEFIELIKNEIGLDLTNLKDWDISSESEGDHAHDGDNCDYKVIFCSPDGDEYITYDNHNLINGWSFDDDEEVVFD